MAMIAAIYNFKHKSAYKVLWEYFVCNKIKNKFEKRSDLILLCSEIP